MKPYIVLLKASLAFSLLLLIILSCSKRGNKSEVFFNDTITKDWYYDITILEKANPQKEKYKYPDGKNPKYVGKSNEQIYRIIFIKEPSKDKMGSIFQFYKEYYRKRAAQLDDEVTLSVTFYNQLISAKDADPDNDNYNIKIDDYVCGNYAYNYRNKTTFGDGSSEFSK